MTKENTQQKVEEHPDQGYYSELKTKIKTIKKIVAWNKINANWNKILKNYIVYNIFILAKATFLIFA